ncbi:MAG TPA: tetratricopeptide repeat protein [Thermodesulfobacteriota bacterium]|nr:tetratricopeptide repeat protein [Thermodesulfobacteriota bacterium]
MTNETPEHQFNTGKRHLKEDKLDKALRAFGRAYRDDKENPSYMSYFGLLKALRGGEIGLGLELCTNAIKREFHRAELYVNLGRVYLAAGNRKGAMKVFKKGLNYEPGNEEIHRYMAELGIRNRPVIPILERSNPVNKYLGILFRRTLPGLLRKKTKI